MVPGLGLTTRWSSEQFNYFQEEPLPSHLLSLVKNTNVKLETTDCLLEMEKNLLWTYVILYLYNEPLFLMSGNSIIAFGRNSFID